MLLHREFSFSEYKSYNNTDYGTEYTGNGHDGGILLHVGVAAEKYQQTDAGVGEKTRKQAAQADDTGKICLGYDNGNNMSFIYLEDR